MEKQMMLISAKTQNNQQTFRMVPLTAECPYNLAEFDVEHSNLILVLKEKINSLKTVPKLGPDGSFIPVKNPKPDTPGVEIERRMIEENLEVHINNMESIDEFIKLVAINASTFKYQQYIATIDINPPKSKLITTLS